MNLADYLSELLGQHDEVSVPGLGCFLRKRVSGYYNDKEAKFYPPYHQVKFVNQPKEDDTFAQYVADKKNISLASSKYFAEKFVSQLKEQAATGKYLFADIGAFQTEQDKLVFKPYDQIATDPAFYGYAPVDIAKLNKPSGGDIKSAYAEPPAVPVVIPPPVQLVEKQQYLEEETERKKTVNIWLIILIGIGVLALAAFGVYKFEPSVFDKINAAYYKITAKKQDTVIPVYRHEIKADTIKKAVQAKNTALKTPVVTPPVTTADTAKPSQFAIIADKLQKWRMNKAESEVKRYKLIGIDARILSPAEAPGPLIKISVGTYLSNDSAETERLNLIRTGKIKKKLEILEIKPQK